MGSEVFAKNDGKIKKKEKKTAVWCVLYLSTSRRRLRGREQARNGAQPGAKEPARGWEGMREISRDNRHIDEREWGEGGDREKERKREREKRQKERAREKDSSLASKFVHKEGGANGGWWRL